MRHSHECRMYERINDWVHHRERIKEINENLTLRIVVQSGHKTQSCREHRKEFDDDCPLYCIDIVESISSSYGSPCIKSLVCKLIDSW